MLWLLLSDKKAIIWIILMIGGGLSNIALSVALEGNTGKINYNI